MTINTLSSSMIHAIETFLSVGWYNGNEEDIYDIINAIVDSKEGLILRPEEWYSKTNNGVDEFCGIFWSCLVMIFGDYGTSPRYGWLIKSKCDELSLVISTFLKDRRIENGSET